MKILTAQVDWMEKWSNTPNLKILVDKFPNMDDLRYEKRGSLYFAELDGYASFFAWRGSQDDGYAGRHFPITLVTGEEVTLKGPWSSNAKAMSNAGFTECMEVSFTDNPEVMERGHTFYSGSITVELAKKVIEEHLPNIALFKDDFSIYPALNLGGKPGKIGTNWKHITKGTKLFFEV